MRFTAIVKRKHAVGSAAFLGLCLAVACTLTLGGRKAETEPTAELPWNQDAWRKASNTSSIRNPRYLMRISAMRQLRLGMSRREVEKVLGQPTSSFLTGSTRPEPFPDEVAFTSGKASPSDGVDLYATGSMHDGSDWQYLIVVRFDARGTLKMAYTALN